MKIAWYTPFSIDSAIGRFSHLVIEQLRQLGVEVVVVRSESKTAAMRGRGPVCRNERWTWASDVEKLVEAQWPGYDLVVYNLGDHHEYHAMCYEHQERAPGLSILHDFCLHHALYQFCLATSPSNGTYRDHLHLECGSAAVQAYEEATTLGHETTWWHEQIAQHPVYRWALRNTLGVVTHADFYRDIVSERVGAPVTTIPLAYDSPASSLRIHTPSDDANQQKLTILTVGAVNKNKRYDAVIRAMAESPTLRQRCQFRIVGHIAPDRRKAIEAAVAAQKHRPDVTITGAVTREELKTELEQADIISCLRFPALEGASASVIEGLLAGKPVVACDTGCYREIPDDLVFKISPEREHADLTRTLESIVNDYKQASHRGHAAQLWTRTRHNPAAYANQLVSFMHRVLYNRPALAVTDRIAQHFETWNVPADDHFMRRLDRAMIGLFGRSTDHTQRAAS